MHLLPADISGVSCGHGEVNADVFDMHRVSVRDKRFRCGCPRRELWVRWFQGRFAEMKLVCVIMASGEGKRFGSNKMLADIYGEPLIQRTIESVPKGFDVVVTTRWPLSCRDLP